MPTTLLYRRPLGQWGPRLIPTLTGAGWLVRRAQGDAAPSVRASEMWSYDGAAASTVPVQSIASGGLAISASVASAVKVGAAASCALSLSGACVSSVPVGAAVSGSMTFAGSVAASVPVSGAASADLALDGTASGAVPLGVAGACALTLDGACSGSVQIDGAASGTLSLSGEATPSVAVAAAASGACALSGEAACSVAVACAVVGRYSLPFPARPSTAVVTTRPAYALTSAPTLTAALLTRTGTDAASAPAVTLPLTTATRTEVSSVATYIKRLDDTLPVFSATLTLNGTAYNLNDAGNAVSSAALHYRLRGASTWVVRALTIPSGSGGTVTYTWQSGEPAAAGTYEYAVQLTYATGDLLSFPNGDGFATFTITAGSS